TAIGASRARVAAQLLIESLVLAAAGALAGLLVAFWSVPLLAALANAPGVGAIEVDGAALAFTLAVALATGLLFGFAPALQTTRVDVAAAINEAGRGAAAGAGHNGLRRALVISEIALAAMLLVGAGLLTRSLVRLQGVPAGFDPSRLLVADLPLS